MTNNEMRNILMEHRPERPIKAEGRLFQQAIDKACFGLEMFDRWLLQNPKNRDAGQQIDGEEKVFSDGILYIIEENRHTSHEIIICGELDKPISLSDIRKKYKGQLVIHEDYLAGSIYRYGNHGDFWEQVGMTIGFA